MQHGGRHGPLNAVEQCFAERSGVTKGPDPLTAARSVPNVIVPSARRRGGKLRLFGGTERQED
jgi:hypothetical protein